MKIAHSKQNKKSYSHAKKCEFGTVTVQGFDKKQMGEKLKYNTELVIARLLPYTIVHGIATAAAYTHVRTDVCAL